MYKLFLGILIPALVIVLLALVLFVGLGALLAFILPLSLFQAAALVIGASIAASTLLFMIAYVIRITREFSPWDEYPTDDDEEYDEPIIIPKSHMPRNAPCSCGSGKKYKHCCGS